MHRIIIDHSLLLQLLVTFIIRNSNDNQQQVLAFKLNLPLNNIKSIHDGTTTTATRTAPLLTTFYPRRNNERRDYHHRHHHHPINLPLYYSNAKLKNDITTKDSNNNNDPNNTSSIINNHHIIHTKPQQQPPHSHDTTTTNNNNAPNQKNIRIPGSHKWLGGAVDPIDGSIYGIPSHATSILRIRSNDNDDDGLSSSSIEYLPLPSRAKKGKFKWLRGIITEDGKYLYGIPSWGRGVMRLTLRDDDGEIMMNGGGDDDDGPHDRLTLLELPPATPGDDDDDDDRDWRWMWHGATVTQNAIYCIPSNADRILKIDLSTSLASYLGPDLSRRKNKWYGGIRGGDGAVYGIPYRSSSLLRIDGATDEVELLGRFEGDYNWHGGVYSPVNGAIYAFPSHARRVLKIDTMASPPKMSLLDINVTTTAETTRDAVLNQKYKWGGGVIGSNGMIYGMPSDAATILKINPHNDDVTTFGNVLPGWKNKWQGGVLGRDGWIYAIPADADRVLRIDTTTTTTTTTEDDERVELVGDLSKKKKKWQGGFVLRGGGNGGGVIYGIPENAERILRIIPGDECRVQEL